MTFGILTGLWLVGLIVVLTMFLLDNNVFFKKFSNEEITEALTAGMREQVTLWNSENKVPSFEEDILLCNIAGERLTQIKSDFTHKNSSYREDYEKTNGKYNLLAESIFRRNDYDLEWPSMYINLGNDARFSASCTQCDTTHCTQVFGGNSNDGFQPNTVSPSTTNTGSYQEKVELDVPGFGVILCNKNKLSVFNDKIGRYKELDAKIDPVMKAYDNCEDNDDCEAYNHYKNIYEADFDKFDSYADERDKLYDELGALAVENCYKSN